MTASASNARLVTVPFLALAVAELAYFTAIGLASYAVPVYVEGPIGSDGGAGLAFGAFGITALLFRPFAGRLADSIGRRPLLVGGALLCAVTMSLMPVAHSLAGVVGIRLVQGLGEAAFWVAAMATLADLAPAERMGEAVSYISLGLFLGLAVGSPLGEFLVEAHGFTFAWHVAGLIAGSAALATIFLGETQQKKTTTSHSQLIHRPTLAPGLGLLCAMTAVGGFTAFAALHAIDMGMKNASAALFTYGMVVVAGRIVFARTFDRIPSLPLGAAALVVISAALLVAALWRTPTGFLVSAVVLAVGVTFMAPALFAAVFERAGPDERGAASGTASAAIDLGIGLGPMLLGIIADGIGIPWAYGVAGGVALLGAGWVFSLTRHRVSP